MNERLRELMLEAGYAAPEIAGRAQTLSELLIKECIYVAQKHSHASGFVMEVEIKRHFGVK